MKVSVKEFDVDMALGNNGLTMEIYDNNDDFTGKLRIGKATVEWCRGKTRLGNGHKCGLSDLIEYIEHAATTSPPQRHLKVK